jgi:NADPH2:quinone reductase
MLAIRVHQPGDLDALRLEEIALPEPGPGEVRVRLSAIGVNFIDIYQRTGAYKMATPFVPGLEGAGAIDAIGEGVTGLAVGDRVAWAMVNGAYAEQALVPAAKVVPLPATISDEQAAALMVQGLTAHYLATDTFALQPGHTALIHAAAGGTGRLLLQVAKRRGARVLATVGSSAKAELARSAGADEVILYSEVDFEAAVKELTDGTGVDVVYDSVGKTTFDKGLNCLKPRGMMVLWGQASGAVGPFDPQILNAKGSLYLTRPSLAAYIRTPGELLARTAEVFGWVADGSLEVRIDQRWPLAEAGAAHAYLADRRSQGKLLLIP